MTDTQNKFPKIYSLKLFSDNEFDGLKQIVQLFSYQWKTQGKVTNVLRNKLAILLTLYLKFGVTKETKLKAADMLDVGIPTINSMNLELRSGNYLKKDMMNSRINHLHDDLKILQKYIKDVESDGKQPMILFQLKKNG